MDTEQKEPPKETPDQPTPSVVGDNKNSKKLKVILIAVGAVVILAGAAFAFWQLSKSDNKKSASTSSSEESSGDSSAIGEQSFEGAVELDAAKNYGDKYANGILPVGDDKYTTDGAKKGTIYMCNANFVSDQQAGATTRGPWFVGTTQWDINKKYAVRGEVQWEQKLTNKIEGSSRVITTNGLPNHLTGIFPVASSDPAYAYDRNPNSIKSQEFTYTVSASPKYSSPQCMGGEVGVMLTGVALFNGFDAGGRDAGAWEIQDGCEGHPQSSGIYHYHTLSSCIQDVSVSTVIGFALDGFPITGPKVGDKNFLTTNDLDECHGIVSEINLDGKTVKTYHYVMTQDFPYSVSCFRATAAQSPGQHTGGQQQQQSQSGAPTQGGQQQGGGMPPQQGPPPPQH